MQLEHISDQNIDIIRLPRRVPLAHAQETKCALLKVILSASQPRLAIDMSAVEFIDSSGLATLVKCLNICRRRKGDFCLFNLRNTTKALFQITHLCSVIPIVERRQDAIDLLSRLDMNIVTSSSRASETSSMAVPCS
jgi:anti-sigma B factor antagonist